MLCDAAAGVDSKSTGRVAPGNGQMADNNALNITGRGLLAIILSVPTALFSSHVIGTQQIKETAILKF